MPRAPAGGAKKAGPKAHKLAERFPKDLVIKDLYKKEWLLGDVVGSGGFGLIYLASEKDCNAGDRNGKVIKIEPKGNGPLYCEMQFYQRIAKLDQIKDFEKKHKLQYLPVPPYLGTGSVEYKSNEYRFLVIPRLGTDLQKLLVESGGTFPAQVVFAVGLRILDALQYMHENEYVHADVKAANILQGYQNGNILPNQVYLVDYGLAYRYTVSGVHKEYKEDPRKAHDGTIEFTSRDAHKGVTPSRRADLEITGYCLMQWLCGKLPWEDKLTDPNYVASCKEKFMSNVSTSVTSCFAGASNPNSVYKDVMIKFLDVVKKLKYDDTPDYSLLKTCLRDGLKRAGQKNEWTIEFGTVSKGTKRKSTGSKPGTPKKSPKKSKAAAVASPLAIKKALPKKSPKTSKSPTKKIITPMTPRSPATSARSSVSSTSKDRSPPGKSKRIMSPKPSSKSRTDSPLTRHLTNGAGGDPGAQANGFKSPMKILAAAKSKRSPAASTNPTRRKVKKRVDVVRNDASSQTSPGLAKKGRTS